MGERQPTWYQRLGQAGRKLSLAQRYYERGLDHFARGRWEAALADLDEAIYHEPENAEYYVVRGLILVKTDAGDEAEEDFEHSLALDPTQWLAHYGRGMRAFEASDFRTATNQFSRAQHVAPDRPEIYFYRAVAFYEIGDYMEAVRDMEFAQRLLGPDDDRRSDAKKWIDVFKAAMSDA